MTSFTALRRGAVFLTRSSFANPAAMATVAEREGGSSSSRFFSCSGYGGCISQQRLRPNAIAAWGAPISSRFFSTAPESTGSAAASSSLYNAGSGVYASLRPPIAMPTGSCMDLTTFVLSKAEALGDKPALVDGKSGKTFAFSELKKLVCTVEIGLVSIGIHQRDVVAVLSRNSVHYPVIFLAITSVGGVMAAINPLSSAAEVKRQVKLSGATAIIAQEEFKDKVMELEDVKTVIIQKGENKVRVSGKETTFSELLQYDPDCDSILETEIEQDDDAAILFSSGTTGMSKAVVLSHGNIMAQLLQLEQAVPESCGDGAVHLCALPMCHVFGLFVITLQQLYRGGTVVVVPKFELNEAVQLIEQHKVTDLYVVPNILVNLLKIMTTSSTSSSISSRISSLQRIMSGGAPLGKEQVEQLSTHLPNATFLQIYGLTETCGAMTLNNLGENASSPASVGTLLSNVEAKVVSPDSEFLAPKAQGELLLRGPNVMKGYADDKEANAAALDKEGWLRTGDLVSFDEQGQLFVVDRIKELIKYKAHQVAPAELEAVLLTHADILDAAVVPLPSEAAGQIPVAFVVKAPASSLSGDAVMSFVAQQVAPYKKIRGVHFVAAIPKTMSGKILRKDLVVPMK